MPSLRKCPASGCDYSSVLRRRVRPHPLADLRRTFGDLGEAHDRHEVLHLDLATVDLLEEVDHLVQAAELGIVVLDVAPGELVDPLHVDAVDHGLEDPLARRVLEPHGDHDHLALAVLLALVAESDRRGLAAALELVDEDRRVEVEDEHDAGRLAALRQRARCGADHGSSATSGTKRTGTTASPAPSPTRTSTLSYPSSVRTSRAPSARLSNRSMVTTWRQRRDRTAAA